MRLHTANYKINVGVKLWEGQTTGVQAQSSASIFVNFAFLKKR
jgi:hypothetical protein